MPPLSQAELSSLARFGIEPRVRELADIGAILNVFPYQHAWRNDYKIKSVTTSLASDAIMCIDAAILAYGLLDFFPSLWRRLLAIHRRGPDGEECGHVVTLYRDPNGRYGAFGRSNFRNLEHRPAQYDDPMTLALSYANGYRRNGFTPLCFGSSALEPLCEDLDWRRSPDPLNALSERLQACYEFALEIPEVG
jgi:hypothetical protein